MGIQETVAQEPFWIVIIIFVAVVIFVLISKIGFSSGGSLDQIDFITSIIQSITGIRAGPA